MARHLADTGDYRVHVLSWRPCPFPYLTPIDKVVAKLLEALKTCATQHAVVEEDGLHWVHMPYLLAPYPLCQRFNRSQLGQFIRQQNIRAVISANAYHFSVPKRSHKDVLYLYDVVDDHLSPQSGPLWQRTRLFTLAECRKADRILTISHALQDTLAEEGFKNTVRIPNGVDFSAFQDVSPEAVQAVRDRYGLQDRFVIGYIGNHGWWSGLRFLMDAFDRVRETLPHACLMIVGPGEELPALRKKAGSRNDVVLTGPVPPPEVAAYFHASSLGVLPFELNPFTHHALPLKILEYGAARKRVLATPLKELSTLALPHVSLLEPDPDIWAEALIREARQPTPWQPGWDAVIQDYDWPRLLAPLRDLLRDGLKEGLHASAL